MGVFHCKYGVALLEIYLSENASQKRTAQETVAATLAALEGNNNLENDLELGEHSRLGHELSRVGRLNDDEHGV